MSRAERENAPGPEQLEAVIRSLELEAPYWLEVAWYARRRKTKHEREKWELAARHLRDFGVALVMRRKRPKK